MTKIVLLNGPPRAGKDVGGRVLVGKSYWSPEYRIEKFARVVKEGCHAAYGLFDENDRPLPHDTFEDHKDEPRKEFYGRTPRDVYIAFSEAFMKPLHGKRIFGEILLRQMQDTYLGTALKLIVVTDCGFRPEAEVLVEHFGAGNCFLARIHRNGCSFDGDSRGWVDLSDLGVTSVDVENPGTIDFKERLRPVQEWLVKKTSI